MTDNDILMEIYRRMYQESDPPADIFELIDSGEANQPNWFMNYYLSMERQVEILEEVLKEYKLSKRKKEAFRFAVMLGAGPSMHKEEPPIA